VGTVLVITGHTHTMRAIAHHTLAGPFSEVDLPVPTPGPRDLVVEVRAVSVNPVDTKVHASSDPTTITAWESLFDRFRVQSDDTGTLLVMGAAGGVGSMVIQLARALTGLTAIGTASREESRRWAGDLGAHHVVDHHDLVADTRAVAPDGVDLIFSSHTAGMIETYAELLNPGGAVVAIDEPEGLETLPLKDKSLTLHWELMFTRPLFAPPDMVAQHDLLARVAELVDAGTVRTTLAERLDGLTPENLQRAHDRVAEGHMVGKIVLEA
jgi:NADPH2:quinone reductase